MSFSLLFILFIAIYYLLNTASTEKFSEVYLRY